MKKILLTQAMLVFILGLSIGQSTSDEALNLEGVLDIFENSESIENFEANLNAENYTHNLDLNEDGEIDYLRVEDKSEGDVHAIIIQALLGEGDTQDVAVIEIEKTGDEKATLQIIGDDNVYEEKLIVEPFEEVAKSDGKGPNAEYTISRVVVNVFFWAPVRQIYRRSYRPWVSPYRWNVYPRMWKPWKVRHVNVLRKHRVHHHRFHRVQTHRVTRAHKVYTPHRKTSKTVTKRTTIRRGKKGKVKTTTVKTKTTKAKSGNTVVKKTRKKKIKKKKR